MQKTKPKKIYILLQEKNRYKKGEDKLNQIFKL